ncbi:MAG: ribosome-associated translation inhibitor RaiA [Clostridia bacterium]|nr:ribosome-associated translation inhibitor RaiA [Clostridia bacterium]
MTVRFSTKDATVYDKDRKAMEKKLSQRLTRYFGNDPVEASVKISETKLGFKAEITLPYYGYQMRAEASSNDGLYTAFDNAVDVLERRMTKHKDKIINRKGKVSQPDVISEAEPAEEQDYANEEEFKIVRIKRYEFKPMTTEEAILNMETLGHDFYVFMNPAENDALCTVYKRKDGGYGMVAPK